MKNTSYLLAALLALASLASAQPQITQSNLPQSGDHATVALCSGIPSPGNPGANQIWDMSGLTETDEVYFDYMDPGSTPWGGVFTSADLCAVNWLNTYTFYDVSESALTIEGNGIPIAPGDTIKIDYSNSEKVLDLPSTMGSSFHDTFSGLTYVGGFGIPFSGFVDLEADGYGTLILPNGTYQNVVRFYAHREQSISGNTTTRDEWAWVSADKRFWLLLMSTTVGVTTEHQIWYDKAPLDSVTPVASASWGRIKAIY